MIFSCCDFWRIPDPRPLCYREDWGGPSDYGRQGDWELILYLSRRSDNLDIVFWHWWILAGLLIILELVSPRFVFLWLGFAAAGVGFLLLVFPNIPVRVQLALFGGLSIIAMVAWRRYRKNPAARAD